MTSAELPWAPSPTRPEVDLQCPACRRECATVYWHLRAFPECRGVVAELGYVTTGGSIGTDFPLEAHIPYVDPDPEADDDTPEPTPQPTAPPAAVQAQLNWN